MKKNVIGCQVGAISFIDEGVNNVLDFLHDEAAVNSIFVSALSWARGNAGRSTGGFPDHGVAEPDILQGGAFFKPDPKYYRATFLQEFTAPDPLYTGFDTLADVIPAAKERGVDTYLYYCETSRQEPRSRWVPGWINILEKDIEGRRSFRPCYNNPQYQTWWRGVVEDLANNHDLAGILWNLERKSPLVAVLDGEAPTCFCEHCRAEGRARNIDVDRAQEGYKKLYAFVRDCKAEAEMPDGVMATFLRIFLRYPEILQWEKLWYDSHTALAKDLYGAYKWLCPDKYFGIGLWQVSDTFSLWMRSLYDYAEFTPWADFMKPILYNVPGGSRYKAQLDKWYKTLFRDIESVQILAQVHMAMIGQQEAPYDRLAAEGFTPAYITNNVRRIIKKTGGQVPVFPGLPSGVKDVGYLQATPEDIIKDVKAVYEGGGQGVILSRNYSEADKDVMRACKRGVEELGLDVISDRGSVGSDKSIY